MYMDGGKCSTRQPMVNRRYPDWRLIDEISIQLLEEGVGSFDVLQRSLPSIVLCRVEKLVIYSCVFLNIHICLVIFLKNIY
uniref:Ovule protein n=1 Tax=Ascaris lumbricoides TaxID=6252 RepID=A0A0M3HZP7_ASCLU